MSSLLTTYIALGANLNDPAQQIRQGMAMLAALPECKEVARSSLYCTAPVGAGTEGHPDYINAVVALSTTLESGVLLNFLQAIEKQQGRCRHDGTMLPRTLDLDLLLYGDQIIDTAHLSVPHPRMTLRAFVMVPLAEIAPTLNIPGYGAIQALLPALADQPIQALS